MPEDVQGEPEVQGPDSFAVSNHELTLRDASRGWKKSRTLKHKWCVVDIVKYSSKD